MKKHLLLAGGDSTTLSQLSVLPLGITYLSAEETEVKDNICRTITFHPESPKEELFRHLHELHRQHPFDAVISFKEDWLELASELKEELDIAGNPLRPVLLSRDKGLFREVLKDTDLGNVPYRLVRSDAELKEFQKEVNTTVILKPVKGSGSFGVKLLTQEQLSNGSVNFLDDIPFEWMKGGSGVTYIAEAFIPGKEFSIEALTDKGVHEIVTITERRIVAEDRFVGKGHIIPAQLEPQLKKQIREKVCAMLDAIGHWQGPTHTELKIFNGDIYMVETQTRTGGANIWNLVEMTTGTGLRQKAVCSLLDIPYQPAQPICKVAGVAYLHSEEGVLEEIIDNSGLLAAEHIHTFKFNYRPGEYMKPIEDSLDRRGYVVVKGESYGLVKQYLEQADNSFQFIIHKQHGTHR